MHEFSLMDHVVKMVEESAQEQNIKEVTKVRLVIGKMKAALPEALQFAFSVFSTEPPFAPDAVLEIEEVETTVKCRNCLKVFTPKTIYNYKCPECANSQVDFLTGKEFYIDYYEGE